MVLTVGRFFAARIPLGLLELRRPSCDNLVTILAGNRPILAYIGALASGCNSLKMLVDVAKCQLALKVPTGLRTKYDLSVEYIFWIP
jgi:hypothetical protein